jgi:hypothetical protein
MIQPPTEGQPVDELWRKVAELTAAVNALLSMQAAGAHTGQVVYSGGKAVFVLAQDQ